MWEEAGGVAVREIGGWRESGVRAVGCVIFLFLLPCVRCVSTGLVLVGGLGALDQ
jgi:hypothetical protein